MVKLQSSSMLEHTRQTEQAALLEFHRQEDAINDAESLLLDLKTGKVVVTTDPKIKQPEYVVIFRSDRPLDDSQQRNYVNSRGIIVEQDGDLWHLSESEQSPLSVQLQPDTHITREVRLVLPQGSGDVAINLQRGSVSITGSPKSVSCSVEIGAIHIVGFSGSITTQQVDGSITVDDSRGNLKSKVGMGSMEISRFTGTLGVELGGSDLRSNSIKIDDLILIGDSSIVTTQESQVVTVARTDPSIVIDTAGKPFVHPSHKKTPNGRIISIKADPGTVQLVEVPALEEQANLLASLTKRNPHVCTLRITGPGKVIIGQPNESAPLAAFSGAVKKVLSLVPPTNF